MWHLSSGCASSRLTTCTARTGCRRRRLASAIVPNTGTRVPRPAARGPARTGPAGLWAALWTRPAPRSRRSCPGTAARSRAGSHACRLRDAHHARGGGTAGQEFRGTGAERTNNERCLSTGESNRGDVAAAECR